METKILNLYKFYGDEEDYIFNIVKSSNNFYEIFELTLFAKYFADAHVIVDVGANIGNHTLFFAHATNAKIHSFEPFPTSYQYLNKNISENMLGVDVYNMALGAESGELLMALDDKSNMGRAKITNKGDQVVRVESFDSQDIKHVDFIKIDVEGFEDNVFLGMGKCLALDMPTIWVEINPENFDKVYNILNQFEYGIIEKYMYNYIFAHKSSDIYKNTDAIKNLHDSFNITIRRLTDVNLKFRKLGTDYKVFKEATFERDKKIQVVQHEKAELSRKIQIVQHEKAELSRKLQTTARQLQQAQKEKIEFSKNLYKAHNNKWYRFGQMTRKRKIWTAGKVISKKLHIYWVLRPFAKLVKKVFNKKKKSKSIKTQRDKPQNHTNNFLQRTRIKKSLSDLNVLLIADKFTYNNISSLFNNIISPTPDNYKEILVTHNIDLFFCESAWQGNDKAWEHKVSNAGFRDNTELKKLVSECKQKGIPTIFWNKEDPFHFDSFLDSAKVFDFVYTTCGDSVKKYQEAGCKQVYLAPFFFNPKIFNPIPEIPRVEKMVFAGAYYPNKFPERAEFIDLFPSMFTPKELIIYDRNYNNKDNINQFPEHFKPYIVGHLASTEIKRAYKGYKIALNANSIINSQTMFARRVIETLACNTPIISSEADSIKYLFGDIIVSSNRREEIQQEVERLFKDSHYYREKCLQGVRKVFRKYINTKVIEDMISHTSINLVQEKSSVAVVSYCTNSEEVHNAIALFVSQHVDTGCTLHMFIPYYEGYEKEFNKYNSGGIYIHPVDYIHVVDHMSEIIQTKYIVIMSPGERYSTYYVQDFLNGYQYIDENTILTQHVGEEYSFDSHINPKRFMSHIKNLSSEMVRVFMLQSQAQVKQQAFNINN